MAQGTNMQVTGTAHNISAFGLTDGYIDVIVSNVIGPVTIEIKLNGTVIDTLEVIELNYPEEAPVALHTPIEDLAAGIYLIKVTDSSDIPQVVTMASKTIVSPPYATLNASVNSLGLATTISFEIGTTTAYGTEIVHDSVISDPVTTLVSIPLTGNTGVDDEKSMLDPGTTYHYRVKAVVDGNTLHSNDKVFVTPPEQPIIIALDASDIS